MTATDTGLDVHQLFGIEGRSDRDLQTLRRRIDEVLSMRDGNERRQALVSLMQRNERVAGAYRNNIDGLERELRDARSTLEASRLSQEQAEKKGLLTRIKDGVLGLPKLLWRHKWKIAIAGGVALGAWYFWPYITGYLNKIMSKAPQAALERGMGADAPILGPDAPVSPLPATPTPMDSEILGGVDMPGSPPPPPLPPPDLG